MISYTYISAFTANLITFITGTALSWTSSTLPKLANPSESPFDPIDDSQQSWIGSLLSLGAIFGPFIFGFLADKVGRKWTVLSLGVPFAIAYTMFAFGKSVEVFYAARFICGLGTGGLFTVLPMYLGEIASDLNRGALGSMMNCFCCFGILFSYSVAPYLSILVFNLILGILSCGFMVLFFFVAPETPNYLLKNGDVKAAEVCLKKLRGDGNNNEHELQNIKSIIEASDNGSFTDLFKTKSLIKALIISMALVGFQQLSGINAVLSYTSNIFAAAGSSLKPTYSAIIIGAIQFGASFVTPLIVDRMGRKILLLFSALGMLIFELMLGVYFYMQYDGKNVDAISWLPILSLVMYIITYNIGFGPLPWAVMGELFPANVKSIASSLTAAFCWMLSFFITKYFNQLSVNIHMHGCFWLFCGFCAVAFGFTQFVVIETKGKNVQEIQEILSR